MMTRETFNAREFITKVEASSLLGCSQKTVQRLVLAGKLSAVRRQQFTELRITKESLLHSFAVRMLRFDGEPAPGERQEPPADSAPSDLRGSSSNMPEDNPIQIRNAMDLQFAEQYLAGEATDSAGNFIGGRNARGEGPATLLGPCSYWTEKPGVNAPDPTTSIFRLLNWQRPKKQIFKRSGQYSY